jgi:hypothetical protein
MSSMQGMMMQNSQSLTDDQKDQITEILSQYDPDNLTADDAKSIMEQFRDAGIKPAKGMKETIEAAGFNADKLLEMGRPSKPAESSESSSTGNINLSALQDLQDILNQYDMNHLSSTDQTNLISQLQEKGLLTSTGNIIDLQS